MVIWNNVDTPYVLEISAQIIEKFKLYPVLAFERAVVQYGEEFSNL